MKSLIFALIFSFSASAFATGATWSYHGEAAQGVEESVVEVKRSVEFCEVVRFQDCFKNISYTSIPEEERIQYVYAALEQMYFYDDTEMVSLSLEEAIAEAYPDKAQQAETAEFLKLLGDDVVIMKVYTVLEDDLNMKDWWEFYEIYDLDTNIMYKTLPFNYGHN